ncbi:hypothetical protein AC249_AIPGENE15297 [Exaiptasia diaphana]|nr:hypothetical protein AC249_AIPGENE15297 [Exaiptasia diaphana]
MPRTRNSDIRALIGQIAWCISPNFRVLEFYRVDFSLTRKTRPNPGGSIMVISFPLFGLTKSANSDYKEIKYEIESEWDSF